MLFGRKKGNAASCEATIKKETPAHKAGVFLLGRQNQSVNKRKTSQSRELESLGYKDGLKKGLAPRGIRTSLKSTRPLGV